VPVSRPKHTSSETSQGHSNIYRGLSIQLHGRQLLQCQGVHVSEAWIHAASLPIIHIFAPSFHALFAYRPLRTRRGKQIPDPPHQRRPPKIHLVLSEASNTMPYNDRSVTHMILRGQGVRQNQSLFRVIEVAKRVIKESLPIKCVEAVYLGIYLSQSMHDIEREPAAACPPPLSSFSCSSSSSSF
jgi:hypothetical protein